MSKESFQKLLKILDVQPKYINGKMVETYAIHRDNKLYGYIGKKAFEYKRDKGYF